MQTINNIRNEIIQIEDYVAYNWQIDENPFAYTFFNLTERKEKNFFHNPIYLFDAIDISVEEARIINNKTEVTLRFTYQYKENVIYGKDQYYYNDYLPTDFETEIYYMSNLIYQNEVDDYFHEYGDYLELNLTLPINILEDDLVLTTKTSSSFGYYEEEVINFQDYNQSQVSVNFNNGLIQKYYFPISYSNNQFEFEEILFIKLFRNNLPFPKNIKPLLLIKYDDKKNNNQLLIEEVGEGYLYLKGLGSEYLTFNIDYFVKGDYFLFYVNDYFYYDLESNLTNKGISNSNYTKNAIILPWDYENNEGYISFYIKTNSFIEREINFKFPINISSSLRGNGSSSKYHFEESNEYVNFDENEFVLIQFIIPFNEYQGEVDFNDLRDWKV